MKKLIAAAALATVLASPAFAQSYDPDVGSGNIVPSVTAQAPSSAFDAYARAHDNTPGAFARGGVVREDGAVARDPDPRIQLQLDREAEEGEW
jgi:opacity protein-like surface antigen